MLIAYTLTKNYNQASPLSAPRSGPGRRRYFHFLRNESESASILYRSRVRDYLGRRDTEIQTRVTRDRMHNRECNLEEVVSQNPIYMSFQSRLFSCRSINIGLT